MTDYQDPKDNSMKNENDVKDPVVPNVESENCIINFDNLRLSQNFSELVGVKKALLTVPVKKTS